MSFRCPTCGDKQPNPLCRDCGAGLFSDLRVTLSESELPPENVRAAVAALENEWSKQTVQERES